MTSAFLKIEESYDPSIGIALLDGKGVVKEVTYNSRNSAYSPGFFPLQNSHYKYIGLNSNPSIKVIKTFQVGRGKSEIHLQFKDNNLLNMNLAHNKNLRKLFTTYTLSKTALKELEATIGTGWTFYISTTVKAKNLPSTGLGYRDIDLEEKREMSQEIEILL